MSKKYNLQKLIRFFLFGFNFALYVLSFALVCYADNNIESNFSKANALYEQGNYDEAIKQYNSILEKGLESGNLYYNLGNCYFKKGELGRAVLNYEQASRFIPRDLDLESNYEYACSLVNGQAVLSPKSLPLKIFNTFLENWTVDGLTILLSTFYILILIIIISSLFFKPVKKYALIPAVFMGLFLIAGIAGLMREIALLNKEAIIIAKTADAKFEPMDKATTYFTLYEGMKVEVVSSKGHWSKVKRRDNKSGWIEKDALLKIQ